MENFSTDQYSPMSVPNLPDVGQTSGYENPFADLHAGNGISMDSIPMNDQSSLQAGLDKLASSGPSYETQSAPIYFDGKANQIDRYMQSEYYKELGIRPGENNEERYGQKQTLGDTMQQALGGGWGLAWNTFKDGWAGWGHLINALNKRDWKVIMGTPEELEEQNRLQQEIMSKYAIFTTEESEKTLFNRQFFGNMIQQSGFALGTVLQFASEELLTMGLATGLKPLTGARSLATLSRAGITTGRVIADSKKLGDAAWKSLTLSEKLYKGLRGAAQYTPVVGNIMDTGADLMKLGKIGGTAMEKIGVTLNGLRRTISEANMSLTEARMEAASTYGDLKEKLYNETLRTKGDVSATDEQRIEDLAQRAGWENFKVNAGVLMVMNRIQFDNLFKKFGADKRVLRQMAEEGEDLIQKVTVKAAKDITDDVGKVVTKAGQHTAKVYEKGMLGTIGNLGQIASDFGRKQAAWEATKTFGRNMFKWEVSEGVQELIQEGSAKAIEDYYTDLYNGDPASFNGSLQAGIDSQKNKQGMKTFLMGALTGHLLAPINFGIGKASERLFSSADQRNSARDQRRDSIKMLNEFFSDPARFAPEALANLKVQNNAAKVMERALANNDKYIYEHAKDSSFAKAVSAAKKLNMLESLTDTIRSYGEHMNETQFREAFGVDFTDANRKTAKEYTTKIADEVEAFSDRFDKLKERYSDFIQPERYAGGDQLRAALVRKSLDDAIEWIATNEYRAGRSAQRANDIITAAGELNSVKYSAHHAFRVLADKDLLSGEIKLLEQEISNNHAPDLTADMKKIIDLKRNQVEELKKFRDAKAKFDTLEENDEPVVNAMIGAMGGFLTSKNIEHGYDITATEEDMRDLFFRLTDYMKLGADVRNFVDANHLIGNQKNFIGLNVRIQEALLALRGKQILENAPAKPAKNNSNANSQNNKPSNKRQPTPNANGTTAIQDDDLTGEADITEEDEDFDYDELVNDPRVAELIDPAEIDPSQLTSNYDANQNAQGGTGRSQTGAGTQSGSNSQTTYGQNQTGTPTGQQSGGNAANAEVTKKPAASNEVILEHTVAGQKIKLGDQIVDSTGTVPSETITKFQKTDKGIITHTIAVGTNFSYTENKLAKHLNGGFVIIPSEGAPAGTTKTFDKNGEAQNLEQQDGEISDNRMNTANALEGLTLEIQMREKGVKKVVSAFTITNRATEFDRDSENTTTIGDNQTYQTLLASPELKAGQEIYLRVDDSQDEWSEIVDYQLRRNQRVNADGTVDTGIITRKKSEVFDENGKIREEMINDFPIAIYTKVNGKEVRLGYLSSVKRIEARYTEGKYKGATMNIVEWIQPDPNGAVIDNLSIQRMQLENFRKKVAARFNKVGNQSTIVNGTISGKSDGTLRIRPGNYAEALAPLSESVAPNTQMGVIKEGGIYIDTKHQVKVAEENLIIPTGVNGKSGWVVMLLPTPTGKTLVSYAKTPQLMGDDINLVIESFKAFHDVNDNGTNANKNSIKAVQMFYEALGFEYKPGQQVAFTMLQNYVQTFVTNLDSRPYDPTKQGMTQLNITDNGLISLWTVENGDKDLDSMMAANPVELARDNREDMLRYGLGKVYYNTRLSDKNTIGLNSPQQIKLVQYKNGKFIQSQAVTYKERTMNLLQTNIKGRPTDANDLNQPWIYFDNPVSKFTFVDLIAIETEQTSTNQSQPNDLIALAKAAKPADGDFDIDNFISILDGMGDDITGHSISMSIKTTKVSDIIDQSNLKTECK